MNDIFWIYVNGFVEGFLVISFIFMAVYVFLAPIYSMIAELKDDLKQIKAAVNKQEGERNEDA